MQPMKNNIVYAFNKVNLAFIKELKHEHDQLKATIKKNYRMFDKMSEEYIKRFVKNITTPYRETIMGTNIDILEIEDIQSSEILKNVNLKKLVSLLSDNGKATASGYILIMFLLSTFYEDLKNNTDGEEEDIYLLFTKTIEVINAIENSNDDDDISNMLNNILDDDIKNILEKIQTNQIVVDVGLEDVGSGISNSKEVNDYMSFLESTNIGKLAQQISDEILPCGGGDGHPPASIMDMSVLGDMIQKVGASISSKIEKGEIKQDDLINDALKMMGSGFNPLAMGKKNIHN